MSKPAIVVENISKAYRIGRPVRMHTTFRDAAMEMLSAPWRRIRRLGKNLERGGGEAGAPATEEPFWALRDLSFEVQPGEVVGIIGRNGAGKSTLLKVLSRITEPTSGCVRLRGRVASLLEVGTGFHPELTGRENIYLNGAILGMKRAEINRNFPEIVDFSEIGKFLDTPVKHYSSGMYVRLAFAVAAHLEPEILIVDEVLAVGDVEFQKKCLGKMREVASAQGRTVLLVSHNLHTVTELCQRVVLLRSGRMAACGLAADTVDQYLVGLRKAGASPLTQRMDRGGVGGMRLQAVTFESGCDQDSALVTCGPAVIRFRCDRLLPGFHCAFTIFDTRGYPVAHFNSSESWSDNQRVADGESAFVWETSSLPLAQGRYRLNVSLHAQHVVLDHIEGAAEFDVVNVSFPGRTIPQPAGLGSIAIPHQWRLVPLHCV